MMHWGHANALRQAKALGDYLIVGVHSDEDILKNKGPPVMTEKERYEAVRACKWVDEVVEGAPYITSLEVMDQYKCDFCVHGDDIVTTPDGEDTYHKVKTAGRFRTVPRTQGVSTTQLVGRMLLLSKDHHSPYYNDRTARNAVLSENLLEMTEGAKPKISPYTGVGQYLPTSRRIVQFSEGREPKPADKIVYIDGTFDLFHVGHVSILKQAKDLGDFLIVGILPDDVVNQKKGFGWPVMNLHERVLSVLSCRYVDEVIIGAPWAISEELIKMQKISIVARGTVSDPAYKVTNDEYDAAFEIPRRLGILKNIVSPKSLTTSDIVQRIIDNRTKFVERNLKKEAKEVELESQTPVPQQQSAPKTPPAQSPPPQSPPQQQTTEPKTPPVQPQSPPQQLISNPEQKKT
jgi:ethanolamine-phosphate cytidylyltransferase